MLIKLLTGGDQAADICPKQEEAPHRQREASEDTKAFRVGNSLMVQWLGLCAFTAEGPVQSLVEDPTNHGAQPKTKHRTECLILELGIKD